MRKLMFPALVALSFTLAFGQAKKGGDLLNTPHNTLEYQTPTPAFEPPPGLEPIIMEPIPVTDAEQGPKTGSIPEAMLVTARDARHVEEVDEVLARSKKGGLKVDIQGVSTALIGVNLNQYYTDAITTAGGQRCYLVQTTQPGKLTTFLWSLPAGVDYDLVLYDYDPVANTASNPRWSSHPGNADEGVGDIVPAGLYIFAATSVSGSSPNSYFLGAQFTTAYDANEPNDNYLYATNDGAYPQITGTLDNPADTDVIRFDAPGTMSADIYLDPLPSNLTYDMEILFADGSLAYHTTFSTSVVTVPISFPAGTYFLRVSAKNLTVAPTTSYSIRMGGRVAGLSGELAMDTDMNGTTKINYSQGYKFRGEHSTRLFGYAVDAFGRPAPFATVSLLIDCYLSDPTATVQADANGYFSASMSLPHAAGSYSYRLYASRHYYDIRGYAAYGCDSGGCDLISPIYDFYHFAYSVYVPH